MNIIDCISILSKVIADVVVLFQSGFEHRCLKCDIDRQGNPLKIGTFVTEVALYIVIVSDGLWNVS